MVPLPYVGVVADLANASIYYAEGNYTMMAINLSTAGATVLTCLPVAKWTTKGLTAIGASAKFVDKYACPLATGVTKAPYAVDVAASYLEGQKALEKGNYLEATLNFVSMGTYGLRMLNSPKFCFTEGTQVVVGMEYDESGNFVSYTRVFSHVFHIFKSFRHYSVEYIRFEHKKRIL